MAKLVEGRKACDVVNPEVAGAGNADASNGTKGFGTGAGVALPSKRDGSGGAFVFKGGVSELVEDVVVNIVLVIRVGVSGDPDSRGGK